MALYARYEKDDKKKPIAIVSCPALYENYLKIRSISKQRITIAILAIEKRLL